jgi:hypothetical protein
LGERALGGDGLAQMIGVIGRICHDDLGGQFVDQASRLRCIALLACGQREPPGHPKPRTAI